VSDINVVCVVRMLIEKAVLGEGMVGERVAMRRAVGGAVE
jgi:hypothetical protein